MVVLTASDLVELLLLLGLGAMGLFMFMLGALMMTVCWGGVCDGKIMTNSGKKHHTSVQNHQPSVTEGNTGKTISLFFFSKAMKSKNAPPSR